MIFNIKAKNLLGQELNLIYDNIKNSLKTDAGFEFFDINRLENAKSKGEAVKFDINSPAKKSADIKLLKIQLGLSCNYSCDYCSQRFVERPTETSKKDVDSFMSKLEHLSFDEKQGLKIELWGGEPLVYWKTLKPLVEALQLKFSTWKKPPQFSIITNGSILTPEICYWLMTNDFNVAISHDGPGQSIRGPDPFDDPAKKKIILDFWKAMHRQGRISFNSMLTGANFSRKKIYDWFVDLTGEPNIRLGEGSIVDAYDDGGMANLLDTKSKHFEFRKQAFNDIYSTGGNIGFSSILQKIDSFTESVLGQENAITVGQKCGMDLEDIIAVDLRGNIITCQNVSVDQMAPNGQSHKIGTITDITNAKLNTATHWSSRPHCAACPVLHLCRGSCMFLEGENWQESCANAYSDNVVLFALSIEKITDGFIPYLIHSETLPDDRKDIWGDLITHKDTPKVVKQFPIKVVTAKQNFDGVEVYLKSEAINNE